jgi:hypothetical protein
VTCKNKYADHKDNTTHENPMGGSTHGKPEWWWQPMVNVISDTVCNYLTATS